MPDAHDVSCLTHSEVQGFHRSLARLMMVHTNYDHKLSIIHSEKPMGYHLTKARLRNPHLGTSQLMKITWDGGVRISVQHPG